MREETRNNIRKRWIESIFELAHSEFQRRLWIETDYKNSAGDFTECVCKYFDDLNLNDGYLEFISNGIITETESKIVLELHSEFDKYVERTKKQNLSDKDVLKDKEWINVTNIGLKTWNRLKISVENASDKEKMSELEKYFLNKKDI